MIDNVPMRPAEESMPEDERKLREFLSRYRAPGPIGSEWSEEHLQRLLAKQREDRHRYGFDITKEDY